VADVVLTKAVYMRGERFPAGHKLTVSQSVADALVKAGVVEVPETEAKRTSARRKARK
jgi:hypothetical protein